MLLALITVVVVVEDDTFTLPFALDSSDSIVYYSLDIYPSILIGGFIVIVNALFAVQKWR
jgi:hypothetical protein